MRKCLIVGNWKMNNTSFEAFELFNEINIEVGQVSEVSIAICPPFTAIESLSRLVRNSISTWVLKTCIRLLAAPIQAKYQLECFAVYFVALSFLVIVNVVLILARTTLLLMQK